MQIQKSNEYKIVCQQSFPVPFGYDVGSYAKGESFMSENGNP